MVCATGRWASSCAGFATGHGMLPTPPGDSAGATVQTLPSKSQLPPGQGLEVGRYARSVLTASWISSECNVQPSSQEGAKAARLPGSVLQAYVLGEDVVGEWFRTSNPGQRVSVFSTS
ncbi:hypothetical protein MFIFM68171_04021 [Madurella fahalii]|uniref:Uncharacterized protein n=1 Tax=Madurella fahalii TaxID=1157608 RepID=A0ABQ0G7V4_9PEZI